MEYGHLLSLLPDSMKLMYRKYENLIKKVINAEWSKVFNRTCLKEYLWPTYTKISNLFNKTHCCIKTTDLN